MHGSSDLKRKNVLSSFTNHVMTSLNSSNLAIDCRKSVVDREYCFLVAKSALDVMLLLFGRSGCLVVVATVSAPPAVVGLRWYVFFQCSRSGPVGTCSLRGPPAKRSHYFNFSSVIPSD